MNNENSKIKQSLIMGALTSSFGVFVSKLLGLLYYSPLSSIAGESNMMFYSVVYTYYETLLQISSAGIPFAVAALVAKYAAKKDYKTTLLVKKLGTSLIMVLSFIVALGFVFISTPLAKQSLGASAPQSDINNLKILFNILTIAIIVVPFLSSIRGYVQGLKRLDIYAGSQVLEQFIRVFTIIISAVVLVTLLKFDSIWAIYMAITAASIGAIVAIIFTLVLNKKDNENIKKLANSQLQASKTKTEIIKELLYIGLPYLFISILGNGAVLINTTFFMDYICKVNGPEIYETAKLSSGILNANVAKLSTIPSILALGFGSGMVPYLTESLEENDNKKISKQIIQILDTVSFILVPVILIFAFFAKDIYFIMYGNANLQLGTDIFVVSNIQTFLGTICPILSSIMVTLKLRKSTIISLIVATLVKFISFFPLVKIFGLYGVIYSGCLYYGLQIIFYLYNLKIKFNVNVKTSVKRFIFITICSLLSIVPAYIINYFVGFDYTSRFKDIVLMGIYGIEILIIYYLTTVYLKLPQIIFNIKDINPKSLFNRFKNGN